MCCEALKRYLASRTLGMATPAAYGHSECMPYVVKLRDPCVAASGALEIPTLAETRVVAIQILRLGYALVTALKSPQRLQRNIFWKSWITYDVSFIDECMSCVVKVREPCVAASGALDVATLVETRVVAIEIVTVATDVVNLA